MRRLRANGIWVYTTGAEHSTIEFPISLSPSPLLQNTRYNVTERTRSANTPIIHHRRVDIVMGAVPDRPTFRGSVSGTRLVFFPSERQARQKRRFSLEHIHIAVYC